MVPVWIFGYGSLVWRPAFEHLERRAGYITGFTRRFWQASRDHRGTPESPGRVVTLEPEQTAVCWGVGYRVGGDVLPSILEALDYREKGGYERLDVELRFSEASASVRALVYVATPENPNYVGPAASEEIARVIRRAHGPSGSNLEYLIRLAESLAEMGVDDPHVRELADLVEEE